MSTYLIAEVNLKKPEKYQKYLEKVPEIVSSYGGKYLVRGGKISYHEGEWRPERMVVIRFPNREKALSFYESDEYEKFKKVRLRTTDSNLILVDGL